MWEWSKFVMGSQSLEHWTMQYRGKLWWKLLVHSIPTHPQPLRIYSGSCLPDLLLSKWWNRSRTRQKTTWNKAVRMNLKCILPVLPESEEKGPKSKEGTKNADCPHKAQDVFLQPSTIHGFFPFFLIIFFFTFFFYQTNLLGEQVKPFLVVFPANIRVRIFSNFRSFIVCRA